MTISTKYIDLDVHRDTITIAVADEGRDHGWPHLSPPPKRLSMELVRRLAGEGEMKLAG